MTKPAQKILSWDSFVSKTPGVFESNFNSMVKVYQTDELMKMTKNNGGLIRVAVMGADTRYCGVYYAVAVIPGVQLCSSEPVIYLIFWDNWKGYVLEKGYMSIMADKEFPEYIQQFRDVISCNLLDIPSLTC
jgi:hypothetical protein